jgi:hypothetical protein
MSSNNNPENAEEYEESRREISVVKPPHWTFREVRFGQLTLIPL